WHHEPTDRVAHALPPHRPPQGGGDELPVEPPDEGEPVERELEQGADLDPLLRGPGAAQAAPELGEELLEVAARSLRGAEAGALDVVDPVPLRQPPGDVVAGGAVVR